ncbi:fibrinogen-like protein 1 [Drosophila innubila]|uniref:fibrinogen-like protein 1 n=1 Tax=Drosophila innubila TaxID=198719 RepID=UPI00148BC76A|nr:fibrinogen-like protein 1 [Drosophila innubila]
MTNKRMESTIIVQEIKLEKQLELEKVYKEKNVNSEELIKEKNKQILELQSQILQSPKSETDLKPLRNIIENKVLGKSAKMQSENSINVNLHSAIKENPLIESSDKAQLNANENNVLISQITILETDKPSEIRKPKGTELYFDQKLSKNCIGKSSDVYMFKVPGIEHFPIPCDSTLAGSGWTVIQRRQDGTENFNRNWTDYRMGFGDLRNEFFIGLEKLHLITNSQPHELYIHLEDFESESRHARYNNFVIGNEKESYAIKSLGEYSGNAENALLGHKDMKFSTPDRNFNKELDCAENFKSGWWFNQNCYLCNLNGQYIIQNVENSKAVEWRTWHFKPLKFVQMMIRPNRIK